MNHLACSAHFADQAYSEFAFLNCEIRQLRVNFNENPILSSAVCPLSSRSP